MNSIVALARLTVIESLRKRIFLGVVAFGAAFVVMAALMRSVDAAARVIQLQVWAYRLILFFSVLMSVVLASTSIPDDLETRRLQTLLAKPIRRSEVLLGRLAGFLGILAVYLLCLGLFSLALIRVVAALSGPEADRGLNPAGVMRAEAFEAEPAAAPGPGGARPAGRRRVEGALDRSLLWRFDGVTRERFGSFVNGRIRVRLGLANPQDGTPGDAQNVQIELVNPARGADRGAGDPRRLRIWTRRWEPFSFPVAEAEPGGSVWVRLRRLDERVWTAGEREGVELLAPAGALALEANFAKALALILIQMGILLSLTLAASLFLSSIVTLLVGVSLFLCGSGVGFLKEALPISQKTLEELTKPGAQAHVHAASDFPPWLLGIANRITECALAVLPDLSRLDCGRYLVENLSMPVTELVGPGDLALYLAYLIVPIGLACAAAARKEFA
jgi:hypothetical protein